MNKNRVCAIVVTYNRKNLLIECIDALLNQTASLDILIIDNASTDGTKEYIKSYIDLKKICYVNTDNNLGGAGGFNFGIKTAFDMGYEYFWMMDDDTIPNSDALQEFLHGCEILDNKFGFLSSVTLWVDQSLCKMNIQKFKNPWNSRFNTLKEGLIPCEHATFVSFFLKRDTVIKFGLPIKEFFIWSDDIEYSMRISREVPCYIVGKSVVVHKTANNEGSNIVKDDRRIDRYKFAFRNEMYIAKKYGLKCFVSQILKILKNIIEVLRSSNGNKIKKINVIISSSIRGVFFKPKIEFCD